MSISPNREALISLATFSIDEEFCQKVGGKVFGYAGEATPVYWKLCDQFSLLIDDMMSDLHALKAHIPFDHKRIANNSRMRGSQAEP